MPMKNPNMGKKVPDVGGNTPNTIPPNKVNQVSGNIPGNGGHRKDNRMGGNYVPGNPMNPK